MLTIILVILALQLPPVERCNNAFNIVLAGRIAFTRGVEQIGTFRDIDSYTEAGIQYIQKACAP